MIPTLIWLGLRKFRKPMPKAFTPKGSALPIVANELATVLATIRTPGDFHAAGAVPVHWPQIKVEGVGPVALPLLPMQIDQLIQAAERAPYGRGGQTLVDTAVRRTWQIGADRVHLQGQHWARSLDAIVARVTTGLGVTGEVVAELYKLLVYDEGSFFVSHRDTEKAPGMFATLLIALPSRHSGGELVVRHKEREVRLDLRAADPAEAAYAAFYADCTHEVLPVSSGHRLVLAFNLTRKGRGRSPQAPDHQAAVAGLTELLQAWSKHLGEAAPLAPFSPLAQGDDADNDDGEPDKLVYPLEHAYTPAELSFAALKGADAGAAAAMAEAARRADCELHLALLKIEESGSAEYHGYSSSGRWGRGRYSAQDDQEEDGDEEDFEIGEVHDRSLTLTHWQCPDGSPAAWSTAPFTDGEISPAGALQDQEPDEQHFHEATGNEGASFERTYQRAALVVWPAHRRLAVLCQAGVAATLPYLDDLARRWAASDDGQDSALWQQAHELSGHMLPGWPRTPNRYPQDERPDSSPSDAGVMLKLLTALGDAQRIAQFMADISAAGGHDRSDTPALLKAAALLAPARAGELLAQIVTATAPTGLITCADLLRRASRSSAWIDHSGELRRSHLNAACAALLAALPGDPSRVPAKPGYWRAAVLTPQVLVDFMKALWSVDLALAERAATYVLAWPTTAGLDAVIVPALRGLATERELRQTPSGHALLSAGLAHLRARTAQPLEPPRDWARDGKLTCHCELCKAAARFVANPEQSSWSYKANEADRGHVESSLRAAACDVDCHTGRSGRPYTLICTKNQASHEQRMAQRKQDLADLALLG